MASVSVERAAAVPRWAIVFQHVDRALGDVTGLDILRSGDRRPRPLTRRPAGTRARDSAPAWSPDGRRVAFARSHSQWGVYIVDATGGSRRRLARGQATALAWSPDGTRIAFSRACAQGAASCRPGIYVAHLDGSRLLRVFPSIGLPSWSRDGRRLVCLCRDEIHVFDADGSDRRRLSTAAGGSLGRASWSPDGRLLAYGRRCISPRGTGHDDLFCDLAVMDPTGAGKRTLLRRSVELGEVGDEPSWFSDGRLVVMDWGQGA